LTLIKAAVDMQPVEIVVLTAAMYNSLFSDSPAKGGIPKTDPSTGLILQGYGAGTIQNDLVNAPNSTALAAFVTKLLGTTGITAVGTATFAQILTRFTQVLAQYR